MQGVLEGFGTIGILIAVGFLIGHVGALDERGQKVLSWLAFYVATPPLMVLVLMEADLGQLLSGSLAAHAIAVVVIAVVTLLLFRLVWRESVATSTVAVLCSSYANAVNLGIPIAIYALGDAAAVAPMVLVQLVVLQPLALAVLDVASAREGSPWWRKLLAPFSNPMLLGTLLGIVLNSGGWALPRVIHAPMELLSGMSIPGMLIAFGLALRLGPRPGLETGTAQPLVLVALKIVGMPLVAYLVARYGFGTEGHALLAATVVAALPTGQNIFIQASRYGAGITLSRDVIFATTVLAVPVILVITALLG